MKSFVGIARIRRIYHADGISLNTNRSNLTNIFCTRMQTDFFTKTLKTADDVLQALWLVVLQRMSPLENKLSD